MNLFQKYEAEVKPYTVGKRFICVDPNKIDIYSDCLGEVIEITQTLRNRRYLRYVILTGKYKTNFNHIISKYDLIRGYKPYEGENLKNGKSV